MIHALLILFTTFAHASPKWYLVPDVTDPSKLVKVRAEGFVPENAVVEVPSNLAGEDAEALEVEEIETELGVKEKRVRINEAKKETKRQEREAARLAREAEEKKGRDRKQALKEIDWAKVKTIAELKAIVKDLVEGNDG